LILFFFQIDVPKLKSKKLLLGNKMDLCEAKKKDRYNKTKNKGEIFKKEEHPRETKIIKFNYIAMRKNVLKSPSMQTNIFYEQLR
jgi:hypothetical protein